jgi:alpha-beta hydrolase superfamily lysophospholipase
MKELTIPTHHGEVRLLHFPSTTSTSKKLLCIHGYCCDARIFSYLGRKLSERGFEVYSIHLPGHGKSYGMAGDPDFEGSLESLNEVVAHVRGNSRIFLLGHSLGCTYAMWYNKRYPTDVDGVILMALYVRIKGITNAGEALPTIPSFLRLYLLRKLFPRRFVSAESVVRDAILRSREVQEMLTDPEVRYHYSYRFVMDVIGGRNQNPDYLAEIGLPVLVLHGRQDRNVFPQISEGFFKLVKSVDKQIKAFDCDHWFYRSIFYNQNDERYTETQRAQVVNTIAEWLISHD